MLALKLLRGEMKDGERVVVDAGANGELVFRPEARMEAEDR